ncbi:hypothetical protein HPP92_016504 [Vanilla planifolia]|uniref:Uncharacterized protein n=1 Tax=Vanilla planifolia TaxID=51239 RepID=A0A835UQL7_VANPL|nr:hypothetical protein HPP92_017092 [Vanilla planifolia]KAG0471958.1 hypothetical protein HPP92_016504 [Vanilla planifolia]
MVRVNKGCRQTKLCKRCGFAEWPLIDLPTHGGPPTLSWLSFNAEHSELDQVSVHHRPNIGIVWHSISEQGGCQKMKMEAITCKTPSFSGGQLKAMKMYPRIQSGVMVQHTRDATSSFSLPRNGFYKDRMNIVTGDTEKSDEGDAEQDGCYHQITSWKMKLLRLLSAALEIGEVEVAEARL